MKMLIINGPNLNMLGVREPDLYGNKTYDDLCLYITESARFLGVQVTLFQSNHEGNIVDEIQKALGAFDAIIINPAAFTHTSIAILDALKSVNLPCVEVHLTDIDNREDFRSFSFVSLYSQKRFSGLGFEGYKKAMEYLLRVKDKEI
ncbi:MAG: 3-dehydroquinate dehydratase [Firmicutes bacterium ADurb.Bin300]|nr:MAG: 3-dehydroquinate dehydratase [Firmicutes bacterium ADurb.Bin300]HOD01751.1 type II 3-dehydroquinate dehydratase [Clostridiales bacterium]